MYISTFHTKMCCTNFEYSEVSLEAVNKPKNKKKIRDYRIQRLQTTASLRSESE
jgi:hypothetical protein